MIEEELVVKILMHAHTLDRMGNILKKCVYQNSSHNVQPHPALSQKSFVLSQDGFLLNHINRCASQLDVLPFDVGAHCFSDLFAI